MFFVQLAWVYFTSVQFFITEGKVIEIDDDVKLSDFQVILNAFVTSQPSVNIISSVDKTHKNVVDGIVDSIIKLEPLASFTLNAFDATKKVILILIDSINSFRRISSLSAMTNKSVYVVVLFRGETVNFQDIFREFFVKLILEVYIVYQLDGSTLVVTFNPFSDKNCYDLSPVIVRNSTSIFDSTKFIKVTKKLLNFNNCPFRIGMLFGIPAVICNHSICDLQNLEGRDIHLLKVLSKSLNFTTELRKYGENEVKKSITSLSENITDLLIGDFFLRYDRSQTTDFSVSYFSSSVGFIIPRGRPFTSIESLIKSFQPTVWICLMTTLMAAAFVIFVIKKQRKDVQTFIFGANIRNPTFNLVAVLLGVPQKKLPGRNFARFLLMSFVMFCLVMRSLYQGAAYKFLQSDMYHKAVESIDDIVERGFSFYSYNETANVLVDERIDKSKIVQIGVERMANIFEKLKDPSFDGVLVRSIPKVQYVNSIRQYNYVFEICKERLVQTPVVLYFQKSSFLTDIFNEKLDQLMNAGLIEYWHNQYFRTKVEKSVTGPKPLNMANLKGVFEIWITGCIITFLVFVLEHIIFRFK